MKVIVMLGMGMIFLVEGISSIPFTVKLQLYIPHLCSLPLRLDRHLLKVIYTICNVSLALNVFYNTCSIAKIFVRTNTTQDFTVTLTKKHELDTRSET